MTECMQRMNAKRFIIINTSMHLRRKPHIVLTEEKSQSFTACNSHDLIEQMEMFVHRKKYFKKEQSKKFYLLMLSMCCR